MPASAQLKAAQRSAKAEKVETYSPGSASERVDYESDLYVSQKDDVELIDKVLGGTKRLRELGESMLPKHQRERDDEYANRKNRVTLFNALAETREAHAGMVFRKDPEIDEQVPEAIRRQLRNTDGSGRSFEVFAKDVFLDSYAHGHTFIHVDMPPVNADVVRVRADERRAGIRPYWKQVSKLDAINPQWEVDEMGRPVVKLFVYRERFVERSGRFGQQAFEEYRVLEPGRYEVWRKVQATPDERPRFELMESGPVSLDRVPIVPVYTNRLGIFESRPLLLDLAYENINHWQTRSDHQYAIMFAGFGVPFFKGVRVEDVEWGPSRSIFTKSPEADAKIIESQGTGPEHTFKELDRIESRMARQGLAMLIEQPGPKTATYEANKRSESRSKLATAARGLKSGLDEGIKIHAEFVKAPLPETLDDPVGVNMDFEDLALDPQTAQVLLQMERDGQLPLEDMLLELKRGEILRPEFDVQAALERLQADRMAEMEAAASQLADARERERTAGV